MGDWIVLKFVVHIVKIIFIMPWEQFGAASNVRKSWEPLG